ncbi:GlxA family transcriptional regulator [Ferrovibrio xuzhouensis]|uniref:GlxA family transcriptional regulator n=1 Tax=Ferrovibrio xuzhouensis TaxID=1576914 RepID=A0ABV7VC89_9PROT
MPTPPPRHIVILTFPDGLLLDAAGPLEAFHAADLLSRDAPDGKLGAAYRVHLASRQGGCLRMSNGIPVMTEKLDARLLARTDTLLVAGGPGARAAIDDAALHRLLRQAAGRVRRLGSVCTGNFPLAGAGLLDGRRATGHWRSCGWLAKRFPAIRFEADAIWVRDGNIWTSAGVTAGIDLALALIEDDHGSRLALEVAKALVVYARRAGGQSQFSALMTADATSDDRLARLGSLVRQRLRDDWTVERLAEAVGMSPRSFARHFAESFGTTPAQYVARIRLEAARAALEQTHQPLGQIARRCGFGSAETLRRRFHQSFRVAPADYRRRFGHQKTA